MDEEMLDQFRIVCLECQKLEMKHHTVLYVDWGKRLYMIFCEDCGSVEYYDELGRIIKRKKKKEGEIN